MGLIFFMSVCGCIGLIISPFLIGLGFLLKFAFTYPSRKLDALTGLMDYRHMVWYCNHYGSEPIPEDFVPRNWAMHVRDSQRQNKVIITKRDIDRIFKQQAIR